MSSNLRGFVINEPDLHFTYSGKAVVDFNLCKNKQAETTTDDQVTTITAWEALAEQIGRVLQIDDELLISGYEKNETWQDDKGIEYTGKGFTAQKIWLIRPGEQFQDIMEVQPPKPEEEPGPEIEPLIETESIDNIFYYMPEYSAENFNMTQERYSEVVLQIEQARSNAIELFEEWWQSFDNPLFDDATKQLEIASRWNTELIYSLKNMELVDRISKRASFLYSLVNSTLGSYITKEVSNDSKQQ